MKNYGNLRIILIYISEGLQQKGEDEKVGVDSASVHFENVSEHELLIMYSAEKCVQFDSVETSCSVMQ